METQLTMDEEMIAMLARPEAYPWRPTAVEVIETHISWVFLAGDRVVKVKRPVHFPFIDHSTVERRRESCVNEVRLNQRLTDGIYLDVVPITQTDRRLVVGGDGEPVEWATLMRRLPADRMLDRLLMTGHAPADLAVRLGRRLVPFHLHQAAQCGCESYGSAHALASVLTDNLDELREFAGVQLSAAQLALIDQSMRSYLIAHESLLQKRIADGWVRDGHGDLRPEHICLVDHERIEIFDCIEFNPALRCADVASDLAFLLMELERFGAVEVAHSLEDHYRGSGVDLPSSLLRLYRAHRALVRAKVNGLTLQDEHRAHPGMTSETQRYLHLASRAVLTIRPVLIVMTGLSGTGKSTIAGALADAIGAAVHSSDTVRKELAHVVGESAANWNEGIYAADVTDRTYRRLAELARSDLADGQAVIIDATFLDHARRLEVARVGHDADVSVVFVETVCDENEVAKRLAARAARHDSTSDATIETYRRQRDLLETESLAVPDGVDRVIVDTTRADPRLLDPIFSTLVTRQDIVPRVPETA